MNAMRERPAMIAIVALIVGAWLPFASIALAQGIATAAIRGSVRSDGGTALDGARVRVVNSATGLVSHALVRDGRFFVQGIEVGGPYVIEVRQIGFAPQRAGPLYLSLGEPLELRFVLETVALRLDAVFLSETGGGASLRAGGGTATLIPDSLVHRLPTPNRNFYDFVRLAPQVSTRIGFQRTGVSAAGANLRFNNFLINGVDERFINGNVSPAFNAGKSIPIDAVKEFQVLIAPYDVRYGDFAGALVNTVTRAGTNELHGSAMTYWRNNRLARGGDLASEAPYERLQYGFSIGGPILRDRVHFFIAPEIQRFTSPASGPYVGQPPGRIPPVPVSEADVARLDSILRAQGLTAGSAGPVQLGNPLTNVFLRLDGAMPRWNSRVIAFVNHVGTRDVRFSRSTDVFSLSSTRYELASGVRLASLQLHTDFPRIPGAHNELVISSLSDWSDALPNVRQPLVRVHVPATSGGLVTLNTGTHELAQERFDRSRSFTIRNELSMSVGARHLLVMGAQAEQFRIKRGGVTNAYGAWTFSSLDSLARGIAERYELRKDLGSADAPLPGVQYAAYAGDEWRARANLSITFGARLDLVDLRAHAPLNVLVDSLFGRRTDRMPRERVHVSPRVGFAWDVGGARRDRVRGGIGVFTGRPPRGWIRPAVINYGVGIGLLQCGPPGAAGRVPPPFVSDYRAAPTACATGPALETAPLGDVNLLDRDLRMARSLRGSLAWDRRLPWSVVATTELLATRYMSDFMFVNLNLRGPQSVDRFGRVLYGTINSLGVATPARRSDFSEVIDLTNTSRNYSHQLSTRLERRYANGIAATASYTFSRVRDVQSPSRLNLPGMTMWADARAVSGRHDDMTRGISLNDLPHRLVSAVTYSARWGWPTAVSFYYVGESGSPFTYLAGGAGRGDLNADGANTNDPIYVPRDARLPQEIAFTGSEVGADNSPSASAERILRQQAAFERFIEQTPCLRKQRGKLLQRNSCREPWAHTTIASVRQAIPVGRHRPEIALDIFNVLNLLNGDWGLYRVANPRLLEHVGQAVDAGGSPQPLFRFDTTRARWTTVLAESAFHLQLGIRYSF